MLHVLQDEAVLQPPPITAQTRRREIPPGVGLQGRFGGHLARSHGVVAALVLGAGAHQTGGVSGQQQTVAGQLGQSVVARLRDHVGAVLHELAPRHQGRHRGVGLEAVQQLHRGEAAIRQVRGVHHHSHREAVAVGVEEPGAAQPGGGLPHVLPGHSLLAADPEAFVDARGVQGQDLLHPQGHLPCLQGGPQPLGLDQQGVGAVGQDDQGGAQFPVCGRRALGHPNRHPGDPAGIVLEGPVHHHPAHQLRARGLRLGRVPAIEAGPQHGIGVVVGRLIPGHSAEACRHLTASG